MSSCRFCNAPLDHTLVDLGMSPLCESFVAPEDENKVEAFYPLHAKVCGKCFLVQVDEYVRPDDIFTEYAYFASYSDSWLLHVKQYTDLVIDRYFMLAACAERGGLLAACTRLASFGKLPPELERRHQAVTAVDVALMSATQPGTTLGAIFARAQEAYAAVGHGEQWRLHHQGGSCGYLPREVVAIPGETTAAMANQAFAWNPSITGTKSEDTILCTDEGPELLAEPTDWPMIDAEWNGVQIPRPAILVR